MMFKMREPNPRHAANEALDPEAFSRHIESNLARPFLDIASLKPWAAQGEGWAADCGTSSSNNNNMSFLRDGDGNRLPGTPFRERMRSLVGGDWLDLA
jgi:hypothetical protein